MGAIVIMVVPIGLDVTFRYIYCIGYHVPTHILDLVWGFNSYIWSGFTSQQIYDLVSRSNTLKVWVWFPCEDHFDNYIHVYCRSYMELYVSLEMIIDLCIMYMCVYYVVIACYTYWNSCVIVLVHCGCVLILHLLVVCSVQGIFRNLWINPIRI